MIGDVDDVKPPDICGTTFSVGTHPVFICTLPPHEGHEHANSGGTARQLDEGTWTMRRGTRANDTRKDAA